MSISSGHYGTTECGGGSCMSESFAYVCPDVVLGEILKLGLCLEEKYVWFGG